jgi:inorganic triphosphatase YgiF
MMTEGPRDRAEAGARKAAAAEAPGPPRASGLAEIARQSSTYYDTSDAHCFARPASPCGCARRGRFIQTVKQQASGGAGLFDRPEWEEEVAARSRTSSRGRNAAGRAC